MCEVAPPSHPHAEADAGDPRADRPRPPLPDHGPLRGLRAGADAVSPPIEAYAAPDLAAGPRPPRQRRHGRDRRAAPRAVPGLRRLAADEQPRRRAAGDRPRDRPPRRDRRADLLERQRATARRARVPAGLRPDGAAPALPIWMHPARPASFPDYQGETRSKYDIWWALGWPYETTAAMARLVFAGCSTATRTCRSSRTTWARWCRTSRAGSAAASTSSARGPTIPRTRRARGASDRPADRLLPEVLRRHRAVRRVARDGVRHRVLRRRPHPVRHRHAVRSRARARVHPRNHRCDGAHAGDPGERRRRSTRGTPGACCGSGAPDRGGHPRPGARLV